MITKMYRIEYEQGAPHYQDRTVYIVAESEKEAAAKFARFVETFNQNVVHVGSPLYCRNVIV